MSRTRENDGTTSLMLAATDGHAAAIEALVAAGAEVEAKDNDVTTALEFAELCKHEHAARLLRGNRGPHHVIPCSVL